MAGNVIPFPSRARVEDPLARTNAWMTRAERWQTGSRWGDIGATQLASVLDQARRGNVADWADLCEYAIGSDDHVQSLYTTRLVRVVQAEWVIKPAKIGNQVLAKQAADLVNELLPRIDNWHPAMRHLLHAIALGYAAGEMRWAYDSRAKRHYVEHIECVHAHRFRFDEQWQLRLYDRGLRMGPEGYGELLDPRFWIVHSHQEVAGYPAVGGVMFSCIWRWMFRRWVDKFWIHNVETRGSAHVYAEVPPDTKEDVRNRILAQLQMLSSDHVGVVEQGAKLTVEAAAAGIAATPHLDYMNHAEASLTKSWLGISDAVDPGASGSQAAVTTRTSSAMDPRMVADGLALNDTIRRNLFRRLIHQNAHEFDGAIEEIPIPEMVFKTADDEIKTDAGAKADQQANAVTVTSQTQPTDQPGDDANTPAAAVADPSAPPTDAAPDVAAIASSPDGVAPGTAPDAVANVQATALNGAQVASLVDIITTVAAGDLPRESGIEIIITAFQVLRQDAERLMGEVGRGFEPTASAPAGPIPPEFAANAQAKVDEANAAKAGPDAKAMKRPKAGAPGSGRGRSRKPTAQTTLPLAAPIERALRGELEE